MPSGYVRRDRFSWPSGPVTTSGAHGGLGTGQFVQNFLGVLAEAGRGAFGNAGFAVQKHRGTHGRHRAPLPHRLQLRRDVDELSRKYAAISRLERQVHPPEKLEFYTLICLGDQWTAAMFDVPPYGGKS